MSYPPGPPQQPPPYGGPPPGGWAPPPGQQRGGGMGWLIAIIALVLVAGGTVLTLWLTGVFDRDSGKYERSEDVSVDVSSTAPGAVPSPASNAGAAATCPGVVSEGTAGSTSGDRSWIAVAAGGRVTWNGTPVDPTTLRQYLDITKTLAARPTIVTRADPGAEPEVVNRVLSVIEQAYGCRPGRL